MAGHTLQSKSTRSIIPVTALLMTFLLWEAFPLCTPSFHFLLQQ